MRNKLINFSNQMNPEVVADEIIEAVNEGNINALEVAVGLKKIEKVIEKIFDSKKGNKEVRQARDRQVQLFAPKGKAQAYGATVEYTATKTVYDYSLCGHTEYDELAKLLAIIKARMTTIEKELRKLSITTEENPNEFVIKELPKLVYIHHGEFAVLEPPTKQTYFGTKITV